MAIKAEQIIEYRTDGEFFALGIVLDEIKKGKTHEEAVEVLKKDVQKRRTLKCTIRYTPEELELSEKRITDRIYNSVLCMVYAALHDVFGWGLIRLTKFKHAFDQKVYSVSEKDGMNQTWAKMSDYAVEANKIAGWSIDIDKVMETEYINRQNDVIQGVHVRADDVENWIRKNGTEELAVAFYRKVYGYE